jgi:hypothetical protein
MTVPVDDLLARIADLEHTIQVLQKQVEEQDEEIRGLLDELGYEDEDN